MAAARFLDKLYLLSSTLKLAFLNCAPIQLAYKDLRNSAVDAKQGSKLKKLKITSIILSTLACFQCIQNFRFSHCLQTKHVYSSNVSFWWFSSKGMIAVGTYVHMFQIKGPDLKHYVTSLLDLSKKYFGSSHESVRDKYIFHRVFEISSRLFTFLQYIGFRNLVCFSISFETTL